MTLLRCKIECRSAIGTPLAADTLWGHVAWGIRYADGEEALTDWLGAYERDEAPLIISDPFPSGLLPRPILPPRPQKNKCHSRDEQREIKKRARRAWIQLGDWKSIAARLDAGSITESVVGVGDFCEPVEAPVLHAAINRLSGGTAQEGGGTLHADTRMFYATPPQFDVYAVSPNPANTVRRWLEVGLHAGYGRDATSGLGDLRVVSVEEYEFFVPAEPNAIMLLASASPRRAEPTCGFTRIETRAGRLGGHFALGPTPDGTMQPQKHPVTRLERGSILLTNDPPPAIGRLLAGVHSYEPIRHYSMAPVLPCRLDDALLQEVRL